MEITQFNNLTSKNTPFSQIWDLALVYEEKGPYEFRGYNEAVAL